MLLIYPLCLKKQKKLHHFVKPVSTLTGTFTCGHFTAALEDLEREYHLACAAPCAARFEMPSCGMMCPCVVAPEAARAPVERACLFSVNQTFMETNRVSLAV